MTGPRLQSLNHSIARSPNPSMSWRLLGRSLSVKRPQAALAIVAVMVGAGVTSMLVNLYGDVRRKMTEEFRAYGANVIVAPAPAESAGALATSADSQGRAALLDVRALEPLQLFQSRHAGLAASPMLYVIARLRRVSPDPRLAEFQNSVVVGTDFSALRRIYPLWRIEGAQTLEPGAVAIGANVASRLRLRVGQTFELQSLGEARTQGELDRVGAKHTSPVSAPQRFRIATVLTTGASEDEQVFLPLSETQRWAGLEGKVSLVELSVPGEREEVERAVRELAELLPRLEVRPIRQILYSEARALGTIRWLLVSLTGLILVIIALCVMATMTAIVLERRKDIAVMKALGASDRTLARLFLTEGASLGLLGGVAGFALGGLLARGLAQRLFGVTVNMVWWSLPVICLSSALLAALATFFPVGIVRRVEPAVVLKGE